SAKYPKPSNTTRPSRGFATVFLDDHALPHGRATAPFALRAQCGRDVRAPSTTLARWRSQITPGYNGKTKIIKGDHEHGETHSKHGLGRYAQRRHEQR